MSAVWVVRGGNSNELASKVQAKGAVAVGWPAVGDLTHLVDRPALAEALERGQPGSGTPTAVGQLFIFAKEIREGDLVLTPEKVISEIHVSRCTGAYRYDPSLFGADYPHTLPVKYSSKIPRSYFTVTVRNTLGSVLTVFRADVALTAIEAFLSGKRTPDPDRRDEDGALWADDIEGQARGQILEALDNIEHHDFQVFVAGLMEALGYQTQIGRRGADGGVDVLAYPDTFGLGTPRVKVQVKNQKTPAGIKDVGYLNGVLNSEEKGLFVCTGGFTKDAESAPFVISGRLALVEGSTLIDLVLDKYEQLPIRAKQLLRLRRVYVPEKSVP